MEGLGRPSGGVFAGLYPVLPAGFVLRIPPDPVRGGPIFFALLFNNQKLLLNLST
jgi:hypothetical protein